MSAKLPSERAEILATASIDPELSEALRLSPLPTLSDLTIEDLKDINDATLPMLQKKLAADRPTAVEEQERFIPLHDGYQSRLFICSPRNSSKPKALIVVLFGGGHCVGNPESEVPLARLLVQTYNAVVVLPCYRLAPEHPFPNSINDSWSTIQYLAKESLTPHDPSCPVLPEGTSLEAGFIIGGTSAGANLAASIAHLARDNKLSPPLTGQYLSNGSFMSHLHVPPAYKHLYLSREQNKNAPILDLKFSEVMRRAFKPDHTSSLWANFDQRPLSKKSEPASVESITESHKGLPPTYFQICGQDIARDDSLIYEKVLREQCDIPTRADLYAGWPHCWWVMLPNLAKSRIRMDDTVKGIGWLLNQSKN